jgi:hypothetical protein
VLRLRLDKGFGFPWQIIKSVEQFFDKEFYSKVLSDNSNNEINKLLKDKIIQLSNEL